MQTWNPNATSKLLLFSRVASFWTDSDCCISRIIFLLRILRLPSGIDESSDVTIGAFVTACSQVRNYLST